MHNLLYPEPIKPKKNILEKDVENYLVKRVKEIGGCAYKFNSASRRAVPDRLVLVPGKKAIFVELKAPGKTASNAQTREHWKLFNLGYGTLVIDSFEGVDKFVEEMK